MVLRGKMNPLFEALKRHDQTDLPPDELAAFRKLCSYQLEHNPNQTLHPAFRRLMAEKTVTYGAASTIAPFMVSPT